LIVYFGLSQARRPLSAVTAHRLALQLEAVGVVDKPIQDRVGMGWIADHRMMP
jgi:hypothetical protein